MAAPHVAGAAALVLEAAPNATPATVAAALVDGSAAGKISDAGPGSPNRLLQASTDGTAALRTTASPGIALGAGTLSDSATMTALVDPQPGATIDFRLYGPDDLTCAGTPVFETLDVSYPVAGGPVTSAPFTPTHAGTYRWRASYSGDANNAPIERPCNAGGQKVTVAKATPTIVADASPNVTIGAGTVTQTVTVGGRVTPQPGATVEFSLHGPGSPDCSDATVHGPTTGAYSPGAGPVTAPAYDPVLAGTYYWKATYSGDANNAAASTCGASVTVGKATPTVLTLPSPDVVLGKAWLTNHAAISGLVIPQPGGTLDFSTVPRIPRATPPSGRASTRCA